MGSNLISKLVLPLAMSTTHLPVWEFMVAILKDIKSRLHFYKRNSKKMEKNVSTVVTLFILCSKPMWLCVNRTADSPGLAPFLDTIAGFSYASHNLQPVLPYSGVCPKILQLLSLPDKSHPRNVSSFLEKQIVCIGKNL